MLFPGHEGVSKSYSEVLPCFPVIPAKQKFSLSLSRKILPSLKDLSGFPERNFTTSFFLISSWEFILNSLQNVPTGKFQ